MKILENVIEIPKPGKYVNLDDVMKCLDKTIYFDPEKPNVRCMDDKSKELGCMLQRLPFVELKQIEDK